MENTSTTETISLNHQCYINEGQLQTTLYDKRGTCNFSVVGFQCKNSAILSKMFFNHYCRNTRICGATSSEGQFIKSYRIFLHRLLRQVGNRLGIKFILIKIMNCHMVLFEIPATITVTCYSSVCALVCVFIYNVNVISIDIV